MLENKPDSAQNTVKASVQPAIQDMDDDALLAALGIELKPLKTVSRTPREERLIAGFEDVLRFYQAQGRLPVNHREADIFERLYAVRLEQLRQLPEAQTLLAPLDSMGVLSGHAQAHAGHGASADDLDDDALLAALGVGASAVSNDDIAQLTHVRSFVERENAERKAAQLIGQNTRCQDFEAFKGLFKAVQQDLDTGIRLARRFNEDADINQGEFYILGGLVAYVAQMDALKKDEFSKWDGRLRVIYSNGTESNILRRSLQKALYKDPAGRRITDPNAGPLFADTAEEGDTASGTIYVLRSLSNNPYIAQHRELIHKIGVTGGSVESRIAGAQKDATYLLAGVEIVATYELHNINRSKLEGVFHRVFAAAQLDLTIADRFGNPVKPREWFLVPLHVIDEAVQRLRDNLLTAFIYDPLSASFVAC
jgi:T5orf172 domain